MPQPVNIEIHRVTPSVEAILAGQGIPADAGGSARTLALAESAARFFGKLARPVGITTEITSEEFARLYRGEGLNAEDTPLDEIVPNVNRLSLFAVTLGETICARIGELFDNHDFAEAAMLDAAASAGADLAAEAMETDFEVGLRQTGAPAGDGAALRFSPGYCGWHVSGQKKLFARLRPEAIGIELSDSCLMRPLKSVSGVIVGGPAEIFNLDDTYPFCANCAAHSCVARFEALKKRNAG